MCVYITHAYIYMYIIHTCHIIVLILCLQLDGHNMNGLAAIEAEVTVPSSGRQTLTSHDLPLDPRRLESLDSSDVDLEDVIPRGALHRGALHHGASHQGALHQGVSHRPASQKSRPRHARGKNNVRVVGK